MRHNETHFSVSHWYGRVFHFRKPMPIKYGLFMQMRHYKGVSRSCLIKSPQPVQKPKQSQIFGERTSRKFNKIKASRQIPKFLLGFVPSSLLLENSALHEMDDHGLPAYDIFLREIVRGGLSFIVNF